MSKRHRAMLRGSIHHKRSVISRILNNELTKEGGAMELGVTVCAVTAMMDVHEIKRIMSFEGDPTRMRMRNGNYDALERDLLNWVDQAALLFNQMKTGVSSAIIRSKALDLNSVYKHPTFTASTGWFSRFCSRFDLRRVRLRGEAGDLDLSSYREELISIRTRLSDYHPDNIFNMDETGLMYRALPASLYIRSRVISSSDLRGSKKMVAKDRLTLVVCANATGNLIRS
jgi:hypothetical protein